MEKLNNIEKSWNIEQIYTECLALATYFISSKGEAVVIDPLRDIHHYIEMAKEQKCKIKYVFLTHFHADFVSGHVDLAKQTGAKIVYGPNAKADFEFYQGKDNEIFKIGDIKIQLLHTPGHTMESSCYLLKDHNGKDHSVFTGDTLFIGDVGRPDLAVASKLTKEDLAQHLYDSIMNKIMPLSDDVILYPAHGEGSSCGKKMSSARQCTIGKQKKTNYALQKLTKEEFKKAVLEGITKPPKHFQSIVGQNKGVNVKINQILQKGTHAIEPEKFKELSAQKDILVLDTRHQVLFTKGFIPGSQWIGLDGGHIQDREVKTFAFFVGCFIHNNNQKIIYISEKGHEEEVVTRLSRVGYDNSIGYLKGGIKAWQNKGFQLHTVPQTKSEDIASNKINQKILDVRSLDQMQAKCIKGAGHFNAIFIQDNLKKLKSDEHYCLYCNTEYLSIATLSYLLSIGMKNLTSLFSGLKGMTQEVSEKICVSK